MQSIQRFPKILHPVVLTGVVLAGTLGLAVTGALAAPPDNGIGRPPLVIRDQGNFYVNTEKVQTPYNDTCPANPCPGVIGMFEGGTVGINEAYVDYQFPQNKKFKYPIILTHGGGHHGGYFESTPDRHEDWRSHYVREGFDTYVVDSVNRGRSGYDIRSIVEAAWGVIPPSQIDRINNYSYERAWVGFRLGPTYGTTYSPSQFPVGSFDAYAGNLVPAFRLPIEIDRNISAFNSLVDQIGPSVLMAWSQAGSFAWGSALQRPDKYKAIVSLEGGVPDLSTPANVAVYSKIPILFVVGDRTSPQIYHTAEQTLLNAGGIAKALVLPEVGIFGNAHIFVVEKNNIQIADLIIDWLKTNVK